MVRFEEFTGWALRFRSDDEYMGGSFTYDRICLSVLLPTYSLILPPACFHKFTGASAVMCRLQLKHFRVTPPASQKLVVRALLGNSAIFQDQDAIRHFDGRESVRNQH
jgi:hypothetical protein